MKRITTAIARNLVTAALRGSWVIIRTAKRLQAHGQSLEGWSERLAIRWGCVDDALATLTSKALSR